MAEKDEVFDLSKKDEGFSLADPAALTHPDPVIAAAALNVALWGLDPPPRIQTEAAMRAKALEQQIRLLVDERVRNVPIRNRVRLLYTLRDAAAAIGCGHSKLYDVINSGVLDVRRFGKRTLITAESLEAFVEKLPRAVTPTITKGGHEREGERERRMPPPKSRKQKPRGP
jgi:excisionase family DNA binding protein